MDQAIENKASQVFGEWAKEGRGDRMAEGHWPRVRQILPRMNLQPGMSCLDVGCGNGYAVRAMAEAVGEPGTVYGVDLSAEMIARARASADNPPNVRFEQARAEALPLDAEKLDRLLSVEMLYYAGDIPAVLKEWARVLKPGGGVWVMMDFYAENPYCTTWPQDLGVPMTLWSEVQYRQAFEQAGFEKIETSRIFDSRPVDVEKFEPGWGYNTPDDVMDFRTRVGSLLVSAVKQ